MPDSPQPVPRHSTSPKTPATSPPLSADIKPSPSSKAASPTASPSLPNSWHNAQVIYYTQTWTIETSNPDKLNRTEISWNENLGKVLNNIRQDILQEKSNFIDWPENRNKTSFQDVKSLARKLCNFTRNVCKLMKIIAHIDAIRFRVCLATSAFCWLNVLLCLCILILLRFCNTCFFSVCVNRYFVSLCLWFSSSFHPSLSLFG